MFTITKEFVFDASHRLIGLAENHPCMHLHGHTYKVIVELKAAKLNEVGMVLDYHDLDPIKNYINKVYDHKHLNEVLDMNPTAEIIANVLFEKFKLAFSQLSAITVKETANTSARYEA